MTAARLLGIYCSDHATAPVPPKSIRMPQREFLKKEEEPDNFCLFIRHHPYKSRPAARNLRPDISRGGISLMAYRIAR
jgi:hypothetical protein